MMAARNVIRHWPRSLLTGLSLMAGFIGMILLGGYMLRIEKYLAMQTIYLNHTGHVSVWKKDGVQRFLTNGWRYSLSPQEQDQVQQSAGAQLAAVDHIGLYLRGQGLITVKDRAIPFEVVASTPETLRYVRHHPQTRHWIPELIAVKSGQAIWDSPETLATMITPRLAKHLNAQPPFSATLVGSAWDGGVALQDSPVEGTFTTGFAFQEDGGVLLSLKQAQDFYRTDSVTHMAFFLKDLRETRTFAKELRTKLPLDRFDILDYTNEEVSPFYTGAMSFVYVMVGFFLTLVVGVIVLSVLNSVQMTVHERKTEFGTLLALGFERPLVSRLMACEIGLLTVLSLVPGFALGHGLAHLVNGLNLRFSIVGSAEKLQLILYPGIWWPIGVGLLFVLVATVTSFWFARRQLRLGIPQLLERT